MNILPGANQRFVITGPTGSGKTVFARTLLGNYDQVVIVNPKHDWKARPQDIRANSLMTLEKQMDKMRDLDNVHLIYDVPREHLLPQNGKLLDEVARLALARKNTLLYYDELVFVAGSSDFFKRAPNFYFALTTGRGLGVGLWGCCQRPTWIPLVVFSESEYRATFYLRKQADRARMEDLLGEQIPWDKLRKHKYSFVIGDDMETSPPLKLTLKTKETSAA